MLSDHDVSWPLEPCRYDLVNNGSEFRRVQVKTTSVRVGDTWKAFLSATHKQRRTCLLGEIDDFVVIDGCLNCHLIPLVVVGGLHAIHLSAYSTYRLSPLRLVG